MRNIRRGQIALAFGFALPVRGWRRGSRHVLVGFVIALKVCVAGKQPVVGGALVCAASLASVLKGGLRARAAHTRCISPVFADVVARVAGRLVDATCRSVLLIRLVRVCWAIRALLQRDL